MLDREGVERQEMWAKKQIGINARISRNFPEMVSTVRLEQFLELLPVAFLNRDVPHSFNTCSTAIPNQFFHCKW
jgi:hypothetical protein